MTEIQHRSILNVEKAVELYEEKDGVPVKYVCTTALNVDGVFAADVFFRETPHPQFGNRYFALYLDQTYNRLMITGADSVEDLEFDMILDEENDLWIYSCHRWDYNKSGKVAVDGGRAYTRYLGEDIGNIKQKTFVIRDGKMVEKTVDNND